MPIKITKKNVETVASEEVKDAQTIMAEEASKEADSESIQAEKDAGEVSPKTGKKLKMSKGKAHTKVDNGVTGKVEETQEDVGEEIVIEPHNLAHVTIQMSTTINMGDYNNVKVGVSVTLPTHVDDLQTIYEFGASWVEDRVEELAEKATS